MPDMRLLGRRDARYAVTLVDMMPGTPLLLTAWCQVRTYSEDMMRGTHLLFRA